MKGNFDYFYIEQPVGQLCIDDIGNTIIEANDDLGSFYYLFILTKLGITRVVEYGPYVDGGFPTSITYKFDQFDYNEKRIITTIKKFLLDVKRNITQAQEVEKEIAIKRIKNPISLLYDEE